MIILEKIQVFYQILQEKKEKMLQKQCYPLYTENKLINFIVNSNTKMFYKNLPSSNKLINGN